MRLQSFLKKSHQDTAATRMISASKIYSIGLFFCSIWNFYQIPKEWVPQAQKIPKMTLKCPTLIFGLFFPICFITVLCSFIAEVI